MSDFFDGETFEPTVDTTPNIEFQYSKFCEDEYLNKKVIPENALFATSEIIENIKNYYNHNIDIPILVYGEQGIGKLTCIVGLLNNIKTVNNNITTNNIHYFKILDDVYNKIFYYENIYYLNISILNNNNEILDYLKYIYKIAKDKNITVFGDEDLQLETFQNNNSNNNNNNNNNNNRNNNSSYLKEKKIIIITHIYKCNNEAQQYLSFMLDKININSSYIFTTYSKNTINKKILSYCASINFKHLDENDFIKIFKFNFKNEFAKDNHVLNISIMKQFYEIYIENRYNIGNTISQIKYHLTNEGVKFLKDKTNKISLLSRISDNFIKKKLVLANVSSALEIRKFLYILLSLNVKLIVFAKEVIRQLNNSKLNSKIKCNILEKAFLLSKEIIDSNKEIVIIETFFYDIINIIYNNI
jgi:hypothetical protein